MDAPAIRRCRLCACEEDFVHLIDIFEGDPELQLELKISKLLPVVVMPWDPMPHSICPSCIDKLNSFNEFYDVTLKADRFLRTFYPSVPESERENVDPIVQVLDKSCLRLPPKNRQEMSMPPPAEGSPSSVGEVADVPSDGTIERFIVNHITSTDSVFTCRDCFRTFTKQSAAMTHTCVTIEECGKLEGMTSEDSCSSPLKIRLLSASSGQFLCYLCRTPFEKKSQVVHHMKRHFVGKRWRDIWKKKKKKKKKQASGKPKRNHESENHEKRFGCLNHDQPRRADTPVVTSTDLGSLKEGDDKEAEKRLEASASVTENSKQVTVINLADDEEKKGERGSVTPSIFPKTDRLWGYPDGDLTIREKCQVASSGVKNEGESFTCGVRTTVCAEGTIITDDRTYRCIDLTGLGEERKKSGS